MPLEKFEFRISLQKLLIGLILTIVPLSILGLYIAHRSDRALQQSVGTHFKTIAEATGAEISQFIHDRVVDVGIMAVVPAVLDVISASNRSYQGGNDAAINAKIDKIDKSWNTPAVDALVKGILASPASRVLRRHREIDPRFLRITVTDAKGVTVAATHKTLDYLQSDEEYWQNIYAQGRGAISLTDILYDEVTKSNYIGIGVPVLEEGTNQFIGTVDALIDVTSLFPILNREQVGPTARTLLVKDDGTIISSRGITLSMKLKSDEYAAVRDTMGTLQGRETNYVVAEMKSGRKLIGFADTGLRQDYRNLG